MNVARNCIGTMGVAGWTRAKAKFTGGMQQRPYTASHGDPAQIGRQRSRSRAARGSAEKVASLLGVPAPTPIAVDLTQVGKNATIAILIVKDAKRSHAFGMG